MSGGDMGEQQSGLAEPKSGAVSPGASRASGHTKQILVAGIGNAWLRDDGFGGAVAKLLEERELPPGVQVIDFGSGGLDLAYEVMRGYDALILIDVSRQGEAPGTLYVMEADPDDVDGKIEDGQMLDPHGMDPQTVLRFVKYVGGWPGRVFVVACEPAEVEDVGFGLSEPVNEALARAADVVLETIAELRDA
jgi:hydrogenase maturation protease